MRPLQPCRARSDSHISDAALWRAVNDWSKNIGVVASSHSEVIQKLSREVERARAIFQAASATHTAVIAQIPSGIPHPDGTDRIRQASENYRQAMRAYHKAVYRLDEFVRTGILSDDSSSADV